MRIQILKDITPKGWDEPFIRHRSYIIYDAKRPKSKKFHQLVYQQGDQYGTVGDKCEYLNHEALLELEANGFIRLIRGRHTHLR